MPLRGSSGISFWPLCIKKGRQPHERLPPENMEEHNNVKEKLIHSYLPANRAEAGLSGFCRCLRKLSSAVSCFFAGHSSAFPLISIFALSMPYS